MFELKLPDVSEKRVQRYGRGSVLTQPKRMERREQACRQSWRALALVIKAKLEAMETGITSFEDEFLAKFVIPGGQLIATHIKPRIAEAYEGGSMLALTTGIMGFLIRSCKEVQLRMPAQ